MTRPARLVLIAVAVFVFLGISFLLARSLSATSVERGKVGDVVQAEARGDAAAVLALLPECAAEPACARSTRGRVSRLRRPGEAEVLNYEPSVRLAFTDQVGTGRVAWKAGEALPVVQCVKVRRDGPVSGGGVTLLALGEPIGLEAACG